MFIDYQKSIYTRKMIRISINKSKSFESYIGYYRKVKLKGLTDQKNNTNITYIIDRG